MFAELQNTADLVLQNKAIDNITTEKKRNIINKVIKRTFDILASLIGSIFLLFVIILLKVSFLLNGDYKSIFYTQYRIGKNGKLFKLYKFRSMVPNADEILEELLKTNPKIAEEYALNKKLENDPRITKVGKFIRATSIDELPQIINILKGDMSFIGNRPYLPREKVDMGKYYDDIIKTKPGLTGFWQCSLRSRGTFEDRLKMEKYYSNNQNLKFDLCIFFKTIKVVITKEGAK